MTEVPAGEGSEEAVRRYFDAWNTGDTTPLADLLDPDWTDHAHPEITGPDAVRASVATVRAATPTLRFTLDTVLTRGDLVAAAGRVDGGSELVWLVRMRAGRMAEMWTYRQVRPDR